MPNDRAQAAGYGGGFRSCATENAAHGTTNYYTPELVVTRWQGDWGHLNAMISPDYEHIGVGYAEANGFSWYVMMAGWIADDSPGAAPQTSPVVPALVAPIVTSAPEEDGAIYHTVQSGHTAWTIAAEYGIELSELLALNGLMEDSVLHVGDTLLIRPPDSPTVTSTSPPTAEAPPPSATYTPSPIPPAEMLAEITATPSQVRTAAPITPAYSESNPSTEPALPTTALALGVGAALLIAAVIGYLVLKK